MKKLVKTIEGGVGIWYQWDDRHIGQRIALGKYEPYVTKLFISCIRKNSVVVDVGANIGYYSLLAAKLGAKVYAFEPEEVNYSILHKNVEYNEFFNINIFRQAVGDRSGKVKIKKAKDNYGNSKIGLEGETVEQVKLDEVITEKVDVMKIDVEGWEGKVVEGAKKIIKKYKPVIFLEYGVYKKDKKMIRFLKEVYGEIYRIDEYVQVYCPKLNKGMIAVGLLKGWNQVKNIDFKKLLKTGYNNLIR